jgi:hypothetical protein
VETSPPQPLVRCLLFFLEPERQVLDEHRSAAEGGRYIALLGV